MSWIEIIKKNDKEFESVIETDIHSIDIDDDNDYSYIENIENYKNIEEEFNNIYINDLIEINIEFKDYIKEKLLPFFNNSILKNNCNLYTLYDFIKNNSKNYDKLLKKVNEDNEELLKENDLEEYNDDYVIDINTNELFLK